MMTQFQNTATGEIVTLAPNVTFVQNADGTYSFSGADGCTGWPTTLVPYTAPAPTPTPAAPMPNPAQFISDCKTAFGGIAAIASNVNLAAWALTFNSAVSALDWPDAQTLVTAASSSGSITSGQYAAIKASAVANNIPITLS